MHKRADPSPDRGDMLTDGDELDGGALAVKDRAEGLEKRAVTGDAQRLPPGAPIGMAVGEEIAPTHPVAIGTVRVGAEMVEVSI